MLVGTPFHQQDLLMSMRENGTSARLAIALPRLSPSVHEWSRFGREDGTHHQGLGFDQAGFHGVDDLMKCVVALEARMQDLDVTQIGTRHPQWR